MHIERVASDCEPAMAQETGCGSDVSMGDRLNESRSCALQNKLILAAIANLPSKKGILVTYNVSRKARPIEALATKRVLYTA